MESQQTRIAPITYDDDTFLYLVPVPVSPQKYHIQSWYPDDDDHDERPNSAMLTNLEEKDYDEVLREALKDHDIHQDHGGLLENTKGDIKSRLGFTASENSEISGDLRGRIGWTVTSWAGGDQTDSCDRNNTSRCDLRSRLGWARSTSPCSCKCDTDDESSNVKSRLGYCDISSDEDNIASCVDEDRWAQVCDRKSYAKPRISGSPRRIPVLISTRLVEGRKRKYSGRGEIESGNEHCHCCKCAQTEKTRDRAVQSESDLNKLIVLTPMEDLKTQDKYVAKKENIKIKVNLNSEDDDDSDVEIIYEDDKMTHVTNCCQRDTESSQKRKRSTSHRERSKKDCDSDRRHNRGRSEYSDHRRRREDSGNRRREIGNNDKLYEKAPTYSSKHQDKGHHKAFSYKPIVFSEKKGKSSQSHREDHKRKHSEERDVKPLKKKCVESTTRSRSVHPSVLKKAKRNRHSVSPIIILDSDEEQIGRTDTAGHSGGNSKKTPKGLRISSDLEDDLGSEPEIDLLEECNQIVDNNNSKDLHRSKDGNFVTNSHHQTPSENKILDFQKTETGKSLKNENASCSSVLEYVRENVHGKNSPSLISSTSENCDFKIVPSVAPTNYKTPSEPLQSSEMGTDSTAPSAEFSLATAKISFTDFTDDDLQNLINDIDSVIDKKPQGTEMKEPESEQPEASDTKLGSDQISTNRTLLKAAADELENLLNEDSEPSQSMANNQEKFSRVSPSPTGNILDEILELL